MRGPLPASADHRRAGYRHAPWRDAGGDLGGPRGSARLIGPRGDTTKSGRTRFVPIATARLRAVLDFLRLDAAGEQKPAEAPVFSNQVGDPIRYFEGPWRSACRQAGVTDFRWHDLRHEYASQLAERGVPLSQVRDLMDHASIVTTEDTTSQRPEALARPRPSGSKPAHQFQESFKSAVRYGP